MTKLTKKLKKAKKLKKLKKGSGKKKLSAKQKLKIKRLKDYDKKVSKKLAKEVAKAKFNAKTQITMDELKTALPVGFGGTVGEDTLEQINITLKKSSIGEDVKERILGFSTVLSEGRFPIGSYINGVHYVSYKAMGFTNEKAYAKTFPEKYKKLKDTGKGSKYISGYVSSYNRGKLVQLLLAQSLMPSHIMYSDYYHKAVIRQAALLNDPNPFIQQKAADSLMTQLKAPDVQEVKLDISTSGIDVMKEIALSSAELVGKQIEAIKSGSKSTKQILDARLIRKELPVVEYSEK